MNQQPSSSAMTKKHHPLYGTYNQMVQRCRNPNVEAFHRYGGRGIKVCESWSEDFWNFVDDMGERPSSRHSIDRIDNDGDYCPENCRWATPEEQARNMSSNTILTHDGKTMCVIDWADHLGITRQALFARLKRWPLDQALTLYPEGRRRVRGAKHKLSKLTASKVREIRRRRAAGELLSALGEEFGVSGALISAIAKRKTWKHVA